MYACVFPAKMAERSCPENLISGLQSASSNKGFLQGGGIVYLSLSLSVSLSQSLSMSVSVLAGSLLMLKTELHCKISLEAVVFPLSKQCDATNAVNFY